MTWLFSKCMGSKEGSYDVTNKVKSRPASKETNSDLMKTFKKFPNDSGIPEAETKLIPNEEKEKIAANYNKRIQSVQGKYKSEKELAKIDANYQFSDAVKNELNIIQIEQFLQQPLSFDDIARELGIPEAETKLIPNEAKRKNR